MYITQKSRKAFLQLTECANLSAVDMKIWREVQIKTALYVTQ